MKSLTRTNVTLLFTKRTNNLFKLFALEFAFTAACLAIGRQAFTLFNR
jgi:hypothetical protein